MRTTSLITLTREGFDRAKAVLFAPFRFKVWLKLVLICWLAGWLPSGGCNMNFPAGGGGSDGDRKQRSGNYSSLTPTPLMPAVLSPAAKKTAAANDWAEFKNRMGQIAIWLVLGVLVVLALVIVLSWLSARFKFVLVDAAASGNVAIIEPFKRLREPANAFFWWQLGFNLVALICMLVTIGVAVAMFMGLYQQSGASSVDKFMSENVGSVVGSVALLFLVFIGLAFGFAVVQLWADDFVVPILYCDRAGIWNAWRKYLASVKQSPLEPAKYVLWRLLLGIGIWFAYLIVWVVLFIVILVVGLIAIAIGAALVAASPTLQTPLLILAVLGGLGIWLFALLTMALVGVPVALWMRCFSIRYLEALNIGYRFFAEPALASPQAPASPA